MLCSLSAASWSASETTASPGLSDNGNGSLASSSAERTIRGLWHPALQTEVGGDSEAVQELNLIGGGFFAQLKAAPNTGNEVNIIWVLSAWFQSGFKT